MPGIHPGLIINKRSHRAVWGGEKHMSNRIVLGYEHQVLFSLNAHINPGKRGYYLTSTNEETGSWTDQVISYKVTCAILRMVPVNSYWLTSEWTFNTSLWVSNENSHVCSWWKRAPLYILGFLGIASKPRQDPVVTAVSIMQQIGHKTGQKKTHSVHLI